MKVLIVVAVLLFAVFVWPTPYRYEHGKEGLGIVRIDRLTNEAALLTPTGWRIAKPKVYNGPPPEQKPMSSARAPRSY